MQDTDDKLLTRLSPHHANCLIEIAAAEHVGNKILHKLQCTQKKLGVA